MLTHYLETANRILTDLIDMTRHDIDDIKDARHEVIFSRTKAKDELVKSFENHKSIIDNEIAKLIASGASVEEALDAEQKHLLGELRTNLEALQDSNKRLARLVVSVSGFYNTLLNRLVPSEQVGYDKPTQYASFLHLKG